MVRVKSDSVKKLIVRGTEHVANSRLIIPAVAEPLASSQMRLEVLFEGVHSTAGSNVGW